MYTYSHDADDRDERRPKDSKRDPRNVARDRDIAAARKAKNRARADWSLPNATVRATHGPRRGR